MTFPSRSRPTPVIAATAFALALVAAGAAEARQVAPANSPASSGEIATGLAKPGGHSRSGVSPTQPAPTHHVVPPKALLKAPPSMVKEQVAPIPSKPVPPGTRTSPDGAPHR